MIVTKELVDEINQYFKDRGFRWLSVNAVASADGDNTLISEIYNGDWKHDHLAIDRLVDEFFKNHPTLEIKDTRREDYEGSEGDWYSETHLWEIGEKSNKNIEETDIMEKLTKEQLRAYSDKRMGKRMNEATLLEVDWFWKKARAQKAIIKEFKNTAVSSNYRFIIDGDDSNILSYADAVAKNLTDEQIVNAVVIKQNGVIVRRGTEYLKTPVKYSKSTGVVQDEYKYSDPDAKAKKKQAEKEEEAEKKARGYSTDITDLPKQYQKWIFAIPSNDGKRVVKRYADYIKIESTLSDDIKEKILVCTEDGKVRVPFTKEVKEYLEKLIGEADARRKARDDEADAKEKAETDAVEEAEFLSDLEGVGAVDTDALKKGKFYITDNDGKVVPNLNPVSYEDFIKMPPKVQKKYVLAVANGDEVSYVDYETLANKYSELTDSYHKSVVDRMLSESYARSRRGMVYDDDFSSVSRDVDYQGFDRIDDDFC